jgi:inner membrane protein
MPTIFTHAVIPFAAGLALNKTRIPIPILSVGVILAMLPDADVIGFKFGIEYADQFGHRGASHALLVAAVVAACITAVLRPHRWRTAFGFLFFSMASHGVLDAFTNGGLGPALLWPIDTTRYFAPVAPIRVSPIGMGFFSGRGVQVLLSEAFWVWLPALIVAAALRITFHKSKRSPAS